MNIWLAAFTERGAQTALKLAQTLQKKNDGCTVFALGSAAHVFGVIPMEEGLSQWTKRAFESADALIFIGACGIAVRSIAPYIKDKWNDPAVVVADEQQNFVISLLSGHAGGANRLARDAARILHAIPVITTATDVNHLFAVDVWANEQNCILPNHTAAKEVSAALLRGESVAFSSDFQVHGALPQGLVQADAGALGISVTLKEKEPYSVTCRVIPKILVLGIGCKKRTGKQAILEAVTYALEQASLPFCAVVQICSIDLKQKEAGLVEFCAEQKLPYICFSAQQLEGVPGTFSSSAFVRSITGVGNVCERAAVLGSGGGTLLLGKTALNGVTVAVAQHNFYVRFEEEEGN